MEGGQVTDLTRQEVALVQGKVMSQILPTRLQPGEGLQLVVPSFDGHLYVIDGITGDDLCLLHPISLQSFQNSQLDSGM